LIISVSLAVAIYDGIVEFSEVGDRVIAVSFEVGDPVGLLLNTDDGINKFFDGTLDGMDEGAPEGTPINVSLISMSILWIGFNEEMLDTTILGISDGIPLGVNDGLPLGSPDGRDDPEGPEDAITEGSSLGCTEGNDEPDGAVEGNCGCDGRVDGTCDG
jgi:hypothetical protein